MKYVDKEGKKVNQLSLRSPHDNLSLSRNANFVNLYSLLVYTLIFFVLFMG